MEFETIYNTVGQMILPVWKVKGVVAESNGLTFEERTRWLLAMAPDVQNVHQTLLMAQFPDDGVVARVGELARRIQEFLATGHRSAKRAVQHAANDAEAAMRTWWVQSLVLAEAQAVAEAAKKESERLADLAQTVAQSQPEAAAPAAEGEGE